MREMKDSGVAWIGAVPSDYRTASIGSLFTIKKDIIGREPETVLSITQTGIRPKDLSSNEGQNASSYAHYQIVNVGDFAMNHMDLLTGWVDISKYEGVTSPDYRVFTLNDKAMLADYFLRVFQYYYTNRVFFGFGQGVATLGRWRLPAINFKKIDVPVPPILEQQKIVAAIDEGVGKVDRLIANVQTQIEKLKAYKQSMISEAVTKGLDPTVPMKDSGLMWIGQISAHWSISKVSMFFEVVLGKMLQPEKKTETDTYENYLCAANVGNNCLKIDFLKQMWFSEKDKQQYCVRKGDLIVVEGGDVASCDIIKFEVQDLYIQNALHRVRAKKEALLEFLRYYLMMAKGQGYVDLICNKATIAHFTKDKFMSLPLLVVPIDEQREIVKYLDEKCDQIDKLIAIKQAKIEKLEQYKRSLIYEYVTGKREVV